MRVLAACGFLFMAGCIPPKPSPLAPSVVRSARGPAEIVQAAAGLLANDGFEIAVSDATGGVVSAKRIRKTPGNSEFVVCRYAKGSVAESNTETSLNVSVTARPGEAQISSVVKVTAPGSARDGTGLLSPSDDDCASTGRIEAKIANAIR